MELTLAFPDSPGELFQRRGFRDSFCSYVFGPFSGVGLYILTAQWNVEHLEPSLRAKDAEPSTISTFFWRHSLEDYHLQYCFSSSSTWRFAWSSSAFEKSDLPVSESNCVLYTF